MKFFISIHLCSPIRDKMNEVRVNKFGIAEQTNPQLNTHLSLHELDFARPYSPCSTQVYSQWRDLINFSFALFSGVFTLESTQDHFKYVLAYSVHTWIVTKLNLDRYCGWIMSESKQQKNEHKTGLFDYFGNITSTKWPLLCKARDKPVT